MSNSLKLGEPRCIADTADLCGEGAVWHPEEQALFWVDINGFRAHRWDAESGSIDTWSFPEPVTALNLTTQPDTLLAVTSSGVIFWRPAEDHRSQPLFRLPEFPEARCNDARIDHCGLLWIASMQNNVGADGSDLPVDKTLGRVFSVNSTGADRTWKRDMKIGNTLAWSPTNDFFYTADSPRNEIYRFRVGEDGSLGDEQLWFRGHDRGQPDGSTVDAEGHLWNCRHSGGCILRIAPNGTVDRVVELPVPNPTTCIFGGPEMTTLFITSATAGKPGPPQNGGVFAIETNLRGLAPHRFLL